MKFKKLIENLKHLGLTESEIADKTDTTQATINRIKTGKIKDPRWTLGDRIIRLSEKNNTK